MDLRYCNFLKLFVFTNRVYLAEAFKMERNVPVDEPDVNIPIAASVEISSVKRKRGPTARHLVWTYFRDSDDVKSKFCIICNCIQRIWKKR